MEIVKAILPYDFDSLVVPNDKSDDFLKIAAKPQNFFSGYDRSFTCGGIRYYVHTSYDPELKALGLLD